jgi:hypothetical protein
MEIKTVEPTETKTKAKPVTKVKRKKTIKKWHVL